MHVRTPVNTAEACLRVQTHTDKQGEHLQSSAQSKKLSLPSVKSRVLHSPAVILKC